MPIHFHKYILRCDVSVIKQRRKYCCNFWSFYTTELYIFKIKFKITTVHCELYNV